MSATPPVRRAVRNMRAYNPPLEGRTTKLRLDFNENTVGCSPRVIEFLRERLTAEALPVYPEYVERVRQRGGLLAGRLSASANAHGYAKAA